jgi:4,5-DOPA dioxygenase extradiol
MSALGGDAHAAALRAYGKAHSDVKAIVIVSAHWHVRGQLRATAWVHAPLVYDFGGFPRELYEIQYPAPGAPELAARIAGALPELQRGLDHGAWVPLRLTWPEATIPIVQVSLPMAEPEEIFALGRALRPLRDEGVLIAGSGGIVHNLGLVHFSDKGAGVDPWAAEFDRWVAARLEAGDAEGLFRYRKDAPGAEVCVPTVEHFDPLFISMGAAFPEEQCATVFAGFHYGNLSMRSVAWG